MKVLFIGQSTFRLTLSDGTVLLTDPWFTRSRLWRSVPPALQPGALARVDLVLCSHNHLDHIDRPSLRLARDRGATVVGSLRVARRAQRWGIESVVALAPGEEHDFGAGVIVSTPAFHPLAQDAVGFLIRSGQTQAYFSGDTRPHADLVAFLRARGTIDVAFLQIACARYFGKDDGLSLRTAAELAEAVEARTVVPMHYHGRLKGADPEELRTLLAGTAVEVRVLEVGEEAELAPQASSE